ncbi:hypothetical protein POTOM_048390 [Populus tomentosa]|uniref:UDP-glucuronic acid decarboxylase 1 n=1 Tax=Populus tomentosa TaxID=118781 RepID=A0A8X7YFA4_POPTO|nr:hypothetical protein POTOM_048390 [Populus tomentosa]
MGSSELIFRGHDETQPTPDAYSPKPAKPWLFVIRPVRYLLREKRLVFFLVGMAIATVFFTILPSSSPHAHKYDPLPDSFSHELTTPVRYKYYEPLQVGFQSANSGGKIPLGLKRKGLRIVVTGGAGFVGSHLVDRLIARGDSVIVVDNFFTGRKENVMHHFKNPRFELIRHDVVEPLLLEVDQIYHLACPASPVHYKHNPVKTIKTNVVGTLNMLGLAKRVGARFLLTSTSEVYGDPLQHPQVETYWGNVNPIGVRSCYDEGKRTAETLAMDYHRGAGVEVRIARIFNTYGPRMCIDDGRVVSNFVAQALRKEPMTVYGDGKQTRSFQFVSDLENNFCFEWGALPTSNAENMGAGQPVIGFELSACEYLARLSECSLYALWCRAFSIKITYSDDYCMIVEGLMRLMEGEHVGPFNLGNPGEFTMLELAQVVQETIDPNARIEFKPNTEDDPHKRKPDITKAKDLLGWEPKIPLRKGLPMMVSDFRQRIFGDHKEEGTATNKSTS